MSLPPLGHSLLVLQRSSLLLLPLSRASLLWRVVPVLQLARAEEQVDQRTADVNRSEDSKHDLPLAVRLLKRRVITVVTVRKSLEFVTK